MRRLVVMLVIVLLPLWCLPASAMAVSQRSCSPPLVSSLTPAGTEPLWLTQARKYAGKSDAVAALDEVRLAANSGDTLALVMLGAMLEDEACGPADPGQAARLYAQAASRGEGLAMLYLANLLEFGRGIGTDHDAARDLCRRALLDVWVVDEDSWRAIYAASMGARGITPLLLEQRKWLQSILADPDRALALSEDFLARQPPEGRLACRLLVRTSPMTEPVYMRLARQHLDGPGVARNLHNARVFSYRAAIAGNKEAHYLMGRLLLEGQPDPPAPLHALAWLLRARNLGIAVEESLLEKTMSVLSPEERGLAEDWALSPFPPLPRNYGYDPSQPFCARSD